MAVMAAGMHLARRPGGIVQPGCLKNRQRVHIGTQPDHATLAVGFPLDNADNAGAANAFDHLIAAKVAQQGRDLARRAVHIKQQFGVFMEIATPGGDFGQQLGKSVLHGHWSGSSKTNGPGGGPRAQPVTIVARLQGSERWTEVNS